MFEGVGNRAGTAGYMTFKTADGKDFKSNIKGGPEVFDALVAAVAEAEKAIEAGTMMDVK